MLDEYVFSCLFGDTQYIVTVSCQPYLASHDTFVEGTTIQSLGTNNGAKETRSGATTHGNTSSFNRDPASSPSLIQRL